MWDNDPPKNSLRYFFSSIDHFEKLGKISALIDMEYENSSKAIILKTGLNKKPHSIVLNFVIFFDQWNKTARIRAKP